MADTINFGIFDNFAVSFEMNLIAFGNLTFGALNTGNSNFINFKLSFDNSLP